ncbi:MAG: hypothetical protein ACXU86_12040, partial [Archangium sp.]
MTIRAKVLLFAVMVVGLVCLMGVQLFVGAGKGQKIREQVTATQEELDCYERLQALAFPYLKQLDQVRQVEGDTARVQRELMAQVDGEMARLEASLSREYEWLDARPLDHEREENRELRQALQEWSARAEAVIRALPAGTPMEASVEGTLYRDFAQSVGQRIEGFQAEERAELDGMRRRWDENVRRS